MSPTFRHPLLHRALAAAAASLIALAIAAPTARAQGFMDPAAAGFAPRVPLSAFARPASWFDPSRLHLMSTVSVGGGWGSGTSALQVTKLSYQFAAPLTMSVSLGNTFGLDRARGGSPFFLEGLDVAWRPNRNSILRVELHDIRSPLQLDPWGRAYGYPDPLRSAY